jgi:hypothetical protein
MRGAHDARGAVDHRPEEVVVAAFVDAGVKTAAHQPTFRLPVVQRKLQLQCRMQRIERIGKNGVKSVAGSLDDDAPVRFDGFAGKRIVACQRRAHALGFLLPQPRAALDVRE